MHIPIMVEEIEKLLANSKIENFFDGTLGGGGHAEKILSAHPEIKNYIGSDLDKKAIDRTEKHLKKWSEKLRFFQGNYSNLPAYLKKVGITKVDGVLLDLGISSFQLDEPELGISFSKEGPLDMRLDKEATYSAETVVNEFPEKKLGEIFRLFGEEPKWRKVAKAIVDRRKRKRIKTTTDLKEIIESVHVYRKRRIHPATLTFQALRIFVNGELEHLEKAIKAIFSKLSSGGIAIIIAFHSLEDRIVKNLFRDKAKEKGFSLLTKKPLQVSSTERRRNPRSRSARLRAIQKCI